MTHAAYDEQWRNKRGREGQLHPGTAGEGAKNSLADMNTKVSLMQFVE